MTAAEVSSRLRALAALARAQGFEDIAARAEDTRKRLEFNRVHLAVVGEFNRGKSTFVNALIGEPLLPMDIVPTTAAIWTVERGTTRTAAVVYRDGREEPLDARPETLARLSADGDLCKPEVRFVRVSVPRLAVGDDVVIIDTPGVNDINEQRAEVTYGFLGQADAAVFLLDASSPVTKSESQFLQGQVLESSLRKILFVLNKIDRIDEDEVADAKEAATERLSEILGHPAEVVACDAARLLAAGVGAEAEGASGRSPEQELMDVLARASTRWHEASERWGWRELRSALDRLLAGARDQGARAEMATGRLRALARQLGERLAARRDLAAREERELTEAGHRLAAAQADASARLARFIEHCDVHGRERLKVMVAQSLRHASEDFLERERVRVSTLKGDFRAYAERLLPYDLQVMVKRWFEGRMPEVERFLRELSAFTSREYRRVFGGAFGFGSALTTEAPRGVVVEADALGVEDPGEYLVMALPAAGALAVGLLVTGPFALAGAAAGGFLAKRLQAARVEATRERLLLELPAVVEAATTTALHNFHASIDRWFDAHADALRHQFEEDAARRRAEIDRAAGANATERGTLLAATDAAIAALRDIDATPPGGER